MELKASLNTEPSSVLVTSPATKMSQRAPATRTNSAGSAGPSNHLNPASLDGSRARVAGKCEPIALLRPIWTSSAQIRRKAQSA